MALLDAAAGLGSVLEGDEFLATHPADDFRTDRGVGDERATDARGVAVADHEHVVKGDRGTRLSFEKLHLEFRSDLDAVLLPAGLDDCVHGSSGFVLATACGDRDVGRG